MQLDNFSTTDFYTTAVLIAGGHKPIDITKEGPHSRVKCFHFAQTPELEQRVKEYMSGTLEGNLRDFKNAIENVKEIVHTS